MCRNGFLIFILILNYILRNLVDLFDYKPSKPKIKTFPRRMDSQYFCFLDDQFESEERIP